MKLTHSQISEILSNYTSSSEGFVTLQSLIMNSLMYHERELFVSENAHEQCNGFRSRRWYSHGFEFSLRIPRSRSGNFWKCGNVPSRLLIGHTIKELFDQ